MNELLERAARLCLTAHRGQVDKAGKAYFMHPMRVAMSCATDEERIVAMLHDVIEDAGVTYEELEAEFGTRVADLVQAESEDKSKTWKERKQATIDRLMTAGLDVKMICLGDKLSNLRSTAAEYLLKGEGVWLKFREKDKKEHEWYYRGVLSQLSEFRGERAYEEAAWLIHELFG